MIRSFTRPVKDMAKEQKASMKAFGGIRSELVEKLNETDAACAMAPMMLEMAYKFNELFFFGELSERMSFVWEKELREPDTRRLGVRFSYYMFEGEYWIHHFEMHRIRESELRSSSLAAERLGTLLRLMLWAFMDEYICRGCKTEFPNSHRYGWCFQKVARAIEENAERLLGTTVNLSRLEGLLESVRNDNNRPSMHALREFGFM